MFEDEYPLYKCVPLPRECFFSLIRIIGLFEFSTPAFVVRDPKLLKKLTVKEFDSFPDHKNFLGEDVDPLFGRALFSLQGQKWRGLSITLK